MIPDDRMRSIAAKLLEKSRRNEVVWKPLQADGEFYEVSLSASTDVSIGLIKPVADPDLFLMSIGREGKTINDWSVVEEETEDWRLLSQLHAEASRVVLGWDKALEEIEQAVSQEGEIGIPF